MATKTIRIDQIQRSEQTQMRAAMTPAKIQEYAELMAEQGGPDTFPAIVVYQIRRDVYVLADGFHRCEAAVMAGFTTIPAEIRQGTIDDAVLWAIQANARHGLPRTNADKRRAVETLFNHPVWGEKSDNQIAKMAAVTQPFVSKMRKERREHEEGKANQGNNGYTPEQPETPETPVTVDELTKGEREWYDRMIACGVKEAAALLVMAGKVAERRKAAEERKRKQMSPAEKAERARIRAEKALETIARQEGRAVTVSFRDVKDPDKIKVNWKQ